jgi:hypothetical protein
VFWLHGDDEQLSITLDTDTAIERFCTTYNRAWSASSSSSLSSRTKAVASAARIVNTLKSRGGSDYHQIVKLLTTLCRGTFLVNDIATAHNSTNDAEGNLVATISHHIPVVALTHVVLEYLDSGVHGEGLPLIIRLLSTRRSGYDSLPFVPPLRHAATVWPFPSSCVV